MAGINGGILGPVNGSTSGMFTMDEVPIGTRGGGGALKPGGTVTTRALLVGGGGRDGPNISSAFGGGGGGGFWDGALDFIVGIQYGVTVGAATSPSKIYSITATIKQVEGGPQAPGDRSPGGASGAPTVHGGGGNTPYAGGGGAGAGQPGHAAGWPNRGGDGGNGLQSDITGVNRWYAGGSGGFGDAPHKGAIGLGGDQPGGGTGQPGFVAIRIPGDHTKNSSVITGTMRLLGGDTLFEFPASGYFIIA